MSSENSAAGQLAAAAAAAAAAQSNSPQEQPAQPASAAQTTNNAAVGSDSHRCLWEGCSERFGGPEALYDHICDRHIGRKSTNNLNLECHWANCKTKTVKRDHITSHVRVHVPHKPHRCPICSKAFKRPQDLKKHHKTHAEDSGPSGTNSSVQGPNGQQSNHPGHNGYSGMGGAPTPNAFYPQMQGGMGMNFGSYQGPHGAYYTQPPQSMGSQYGGSTVYYTAGDGGSGTQTSYARHPEGFQALNNFFGAIKQPNFNASTYSEFGPALAQMHSIALPPPVSSHGVDYSLPHVDGAYLQQHGQQYSSIRNKSDLLLIEDRLHKMMHAIETTEDRHAIPIASMVSTASATNYAAPNISSAHQNSASTSEQTPALTPDSSISYSAGHSPSSDHSSMASSASAGLPSYPHLHGGVTLAASGPSTSVPTLGNQYDPNAQQHHIGGRLTRAQPDDGQTLRTERRQTRPKRERDANIDPALVGPLSSSSSSSGNTATPGAEMGEEVGAWLRDVRIIEDLLKIVKGMLEDEQIGDGDHSSSGDASAESSNDHTDEMQDIKHEISYPELAGLHK